MGLPGRTLWKVFVSEGGTLVTASGSWCVVIWTCLGWLRQLWEGNLARQWVKAGGMGMSPSPQRRTVSYALWGSYPSCFCFRPLGASHPIWHWNFACGLNLLIPGACKNKHFQALDKWFDFILNHIVNIQLQGLQVPLLENFLPLDLSQITRNSPPRSPPPNLLGTHSFGPVRTKAAGPDLKQLLGEGTGSERGSMWDTTMNLGLWVHLTDIRIRA